MEQHRRISLYRGLAELLKEQDSENLRIGTRVRITAGHYEGVQGFVWGITDHPTGESYGLVLVKLDTEFGASSFPKELVEALDA